MIETQIVTKVECDKCGVVEEFKANDLPGEVYVWEIEEQCLTALEITNWVCADDATQKCPKCADRVEFEETDHRRRKQIMTRKKTTTNEAETETSNSGYGNSGDCNSGYYNSGDYNSGDRNSGYCNSGHRNSGHDNSGDRNSGHRNSGHGNSGYGNSGDRNSGDYNSGDYNSGAFCVDKDPEIYLFDRPSGMRRKEWDSHRIHNIISRISIESGYKEGWAALWASLTVSEKQVFFDLPNFDADKFKEITGIRV